VEFDAWIRSLTPGDLAGTVLGGIAAFTYLAVLGRAHERCRRLQLLLGECRRGIHREESFRDAWGFSPHLERYLRLERVLLAHLAREGLRPPAAR
jgi:hypothetical protein